MTIVGLLVLLFFVALSAAVLASRWRDREPLFPLFERTAQLSGGKLPAHVVTGRGVDVPLENVNGLDLLEVTRYLSQVDRLPEIADPTEALAW